MCNLNKRSLGICSHCGTVLPLNHFLEFVSHSSDLISRFQSAEHEIGERFCSTGLPLKDRPHTVCHAVQIKKLPFDIPKDAKRQYIDVFDFAFKNGSHTILIKLPESLDWHCTKQELDTLMDSVTDYCNAFYESEICVVSFHRFSNYCVKQAGKLDNLHLVIA
ncbi:MAG: hypothetical protein J6A30_01355 [Ruminococcus sp.]|nr:hypothetical protein [Ruminococcus sp.]